jgi:hypothetical protein
MVETVGYVGHGNGDRVEESVVDTGIVVMVRVVVGKAEVDPGSVRVRQVPVVVVVVIVMLVVVIVAVTLVTVVSIVAVTVVAVVSIVVAPAVVVSVAAGTPAITAVIDAGRRSAPKIVIDAQPLGSAPAHRFLP